VSRLATLIPAYKADFLAPLLRSLQRQTWRDFRIILSDDSPGATITRALRRGAFDACLDGLHLTVVRGPCSALRNHERVLDAWADATPLVHLLMDDDELDPGFYARHAALHAADPGIAASVSLRRLIDADGRPIGALPLPEFVARSTAPLLHIDGPTLVRTTVAPCENWLGELSNIVLSARAAQRFPRPPEQGVSWFGLPDIGTLLNTQDLGPIAVWLEPLGGFRQHGAQTTGNSQSRSLKVAHLAWVSFALQARREGLLDNAAVRASIGIAIERCLKLYDADADLRPFFELVRDRFDDLDAFTDGFAAAWGALLDSNHDTRRRSHPPPPRPGLLILDDFFPNLLTGYRVAEYNALMRGSDAVRVLSSAEDFELQHARYAARYPEFAARVQRFDAAAAPRKGEVVYLNFLSNAQRFLPWIERHGLRFAFTLYPGGGFGIGAEFSDAWLARVLASPNLGHVVTTQPVTELYLQDFAQRRGLALPPRTAIPGGPANDLYFDARAPGHGPYFGEGKPLLDIAFVAEKYMALGENKGYPAFAAAALALRSLPHLRFHVVGGMTAEDIDVSALGDRIRFHGRLETAALQRFLTSVDIAVSLSRPGVLHAGNFDGFPTGSSVEASLAGAAIVASDALLQNPGYRDGTSIVLVEPEAGSVERALRALIDAPQRIGAIARAGQAFTRERYAPERQIAPRWALLSKLMQPAA
jgi:glycosyltransferase involved in cell wall biosynthesis